MNFTRRRAVSPIIASLLLIAIAVAAGIIVYVYVNSLAGGLTSGGGQQVSQQIQMQAYAFTTSGTGAGQVVDIFLKNVGSSSVSISGIYFDGTPLSEWGTSTPGAGTYLQYFAISSSATSGCFALVPATITISVDKTQLVDTGASTACAATAAGTCGTGSVQFCVKASSSGPAETGGATGTPLAAQSATQLIVSAAGQTCSSTITFPTCAATQGTSHTVKIITASGAVVTFSVVAGRSG